MMDAIIAKRRMVFGRIASILIGVAGVCMWSPYGIGVIIICIFLFYLAKEAPGNRKSLCLLISGLGLIGMAVLQKSGQPIIVVMLAGIITCILCLPDE